MNHITSLGMQSLNLAKRTIRRALASSHPSPETSDGVTSNFGLCSSDPLTGTDGPPNRRLCADIDVDTNSSACFVRSEDVANIDLACWPSEGEVHEGSPPVVAGILHKWTNYIHGWQPRYFILQGGTLAYYKSQDEIEFGCRGAVTVCKAVIQPNEFDSYRIDVSVNDCVWYLRTERAEDRQTWVDALEAYRADSGYGSQGELCRHGSLVSLTSNKSLASSSSFKLCRSLNEKIAELETYRDIVLRQVDVLQAYFDQLAGESPHNVMPAWARQTSRGDNILDVDEVDSDRTFISTSMGSRGVPFATQEMDEDIALSESPPDVTVPSLGKRAVDFRGEALTFKATSAGIEIDKRKRAEDHCRQVRHELQKLHAERNVLTFGGPDYEEGPHSALNEDEWYDAVDAALEKKDLEDRRLERLLSRTPTVVKLRSLERVTLPIGHPIAQEVNMTVNCLLLFRNTFFLLKIELLTFEQVKYAMQGVQEGEWQLFSEDGEMKMYKREVEIEGLVCDPLKAVHFVRGVSASEYAHYFFEPEYKMDWDTTLEEVKVVERLSDDSMILHQVHKRVWPASQRESLFWSHIRRMQHLDRIGHPGSQDLIVVCNHDTTHAAVPPSSRIVRVGLTIAMVCQTVIDEGKSTETPLSRQDVSCKITYVAQVNPGGWAPSSVLRAVYKREYPKFLKRFTQYVLQKVEGRSLQL
ncbi:collagen type IV alpha 3 binding protein [Trichuris trichiura]|uniref:Collagen type IV alpha 3 binding protein n=1 Tax=Trichuris trichiura TaxID=36087 RepID=A0A077Z346_TRITR|nr:collagen type IV alpha 3 binding protein [Trichuris trichiura]